MTAATLVLLLAFCSTAAEADGSMAATPAESSAAESTPEDREVRVVLASGRTFQAAVDPRTDNDQLWLRWTADGGEVLRPIRWDRVVEASLAGNKLTGNEFHDLVREVRKTVPARPSTELAERISLIRVCQPSTPFALPVGTITRWTPGPVRSLQIEAGLANWNADVEPDGLLLRIQPLGADGELVPVSGTLYVELIGERAGGIQFSQPFLRVGQWEEPVRQDDFGPLGAAYRLSFQAIDPEFYPRLRHAGAVHARLSVPGQGTFEATDSMVRIRPYSAVRDWLEEATGRRYFLDELTRDGRH